MFVLGEVIWHAADMAMPFGDGESGFNYNSTRGGGACHLARSAQVLEK